MKVLLALLSIAGLMAVALLPMSVGAQSQEAGRIEATQLRTLITGLGYEVKDLSAEPGKEKYEFKVTSGGLDIPIAAEISPSKNYIWLTVYLGDQPKDSSFTSKAVPLLKQNAKVQPCLFYITSKDALMMAIAMDNRGVDAVAMKRNIEKISGDVASTKEFWQ